MTKKKDMMKKEEGQRFFYKNHIFIGYLLLMFELLRM